MPAILDEHTIWLDPDTNTPLTGGSVFIGSYGLDPELNPISIYSDPDLTVVLSNPQTIQSDGRTANKIYVPGPYSIKVEDSGGVQKYLSLQNGTDDSDIPIQVADISALIALDTAIHTTAKTTSYHLGLDKGAGDYYYDSTEDRANHDGGKIIDPTRTFPSDWTNETQKTTWFTASTGAGCWKLSRALFNETNVCWFGAKGDATANDTKPLQQAADGGGAVYSPAGTYIIHTASLVLQDDSTFSGDRIGVTIWRTDTTTFSTIYGVAINNSNITFKNMSFYSNVNGATWAAGFGVIGASSNIVFDQCHFYGVTTRSGNYGITLSNYDAEYFRFDNCIIEQIDQGIFKGDGNESSQKGFSFNQCHFYNITDGLNINSPDLSTPTNSWSDTIVTGCTFERIYQFPVAFAGELCRGAVVSDCTFQLCPHFLLWQFLLAG